jgi:hypothetical protein
VQRGLKNDESNESNILFYSYMNVEDKHNIVTPPWWRLWAPSSTSRTWGHLARLMGSAFSYIFRVVLYWWCVGAPHSFASNSAPPRRRALPRWWCQNPPRNYFFHRQADSHYASKGLRESSNNSNKFEYSNIQLRIFEILLLAILSEESAKNGKS